MARSPDTGILRACERLRSGLLRGDRDLTSDIDVLIDAKPRTHRGLREKSAVARLSLRLSIIQRGTPATPEERLVDAALTDAVAMR